MKSSRAGGGLFIGRNPTPAARLHAVTLWQNAIVKITRTIVVLDAADIDTVSAFWAGLLGGTVVKEDDWHSIYVDGKPRMGVQLAPDHVAPQWPDGIPQQIHLDLYVED